MEQIVAKLLQDFEQGKMSRRQLIQSLALTATASAAAAVPAAAAPAAAADSKGLLKAVAFNHVSYHVKDYTKVRDFYAGAPAYNSSSLHGGQHNVVAGGGLVLKF